MPPVVIFIITAAFIALAAAVIVVKVKAESADDSGKKAGDAGEKFASKVLRSVLRDNDMLYTNVSVSYKGKRTELDNVIVNKYGVFIIEVKYYSGVLYGKADDFEWSKSHTSRGGNTYIKTVKNPVKQVNRQVYILSGYLKNRGVGVWVDGYAIILGAKSPVKSKKILKSPDEVDRVIHTPGKKRLGSDTVKAVSRLLE